MTLNLIDGVKQEKLAQTLATLDGENDPTAKKKLAATAKDEVKKYEEQIVQLSKKTDSEKTKLNLSKLAVDLRKLQQALAEAAK